MITKFKIFENCKIDDYNIGDWIFLKNWWAGKHLHTFIDDTPCQIISTIEGEKITIFVCKYFENPLTGNEENSKQEEWIKNLYIIPGFQDIENWINRKATTEEVNDYLIKLNAKKYNL